MFVKPLEIIGFDLDSTLDRPELAALARQLYETGAYEIHVVTVGRIASSGYETPRAAKMAKLKALDVPYHYLHLAGGETFESAGRNKAEIINKMGIQIMFDDSTTFCNEMAANTDAVILRVRPPRAK